MEIFLQIIVMLTLLMICIQDIRLRAIHVLLPLILLTVGLVRYYTYGYPWLVLIYSMFFLILTFVGLYLYISIKKKNFTNPFKETMGLGDLLFFVSVIPFFSTYNYILFFITGMLFSIVGFMILKMFVKTDLVPLAGLLALYMIVLKIGVFISGQDIFFTQIL